jgi:glutathione peroxidase
MSEGEFMKKIYLTLLLLLSLNANAASIYEFNYKDTNGKLVKFDSLKGKVVLLANIATRCGYTGQLDDLEKIYLKYKNKNLIVIGVPSNDFSSQTPEDNKEVGNICRLKYGVSFPILEKQEVTGDKKSDLYKWVSSQKGYEAPIDWNFEKFIVDKNGNIVERFKSATNPTENNFIKALEKYL